jgi:hypothetical protein
MHGVIISEHDGTFIRCWNSSVALLCRLGGGGREVRCSRSIAALIDGWADEFAGGTISVGAVAS